MTRPYHRVPTKTYKMSTQTQSKEEKIYETLIRLAFVHDNILTDLQGISPQASDMVKERAKQMVIMYNLLKKLHDNEDATNFRKLLKTFMINHLPLVKHICTIGTRLLDLSGSMEAMDLAGISEGEYLIWCDSFKSLYEMRKIVGLPV